jgi:hypothetical protein
MSTRVNIAILFILIGSFSVYKTTQCEYTVHCYNSRAERRLRISIGEKGEMMRPFSGSYKYNVV